MTKNILVTGGAGFLGSHVCDRLLKENPGCNLICLDNLSTGSLSNISHLNKLKNFNFKKGDVIDSHELNVDEIWNLACPASPPKYQLDPLQTFKTSVWGGLNMAQLALKNNARLFHTSTSEVYGDPQTDKQNESYWGHVNPIGIRSCYDEGKRAAETLLFDLRRTKGLDLKLVRIFNTYGPRMSKDDGRVVSNVITQALLGQPLTIYGDGTQTRSFCYVDDLMDAFILINSLSKDFSGPINTGNPNEITILELAKTIIRLTGSESELIFKDLPKDDPRQRCPDISLIKEKCDWKPLISLEDGLIATMKYFKHL